MKTGVIKKVEKLASRQLDRSMKSLEKRLKGEDPEKVHAFLTDIVNDKTLPADMRQSCKLLRDGLSLGKAPGVIMNEHIKKVAQEPPCDSK
jgi:uncharacterized protein (UPF0147 family)